MEKSYNKTEIISKIDYNFIISYSIPNNDEENDSVSINQYELFIKNYSNTKLIITIYEITTELKITKYSNSLSIDYFINQSPYIKCLLLMSKNNFGIEVIFKLLKSILDKEIIANCNNLIYDKNSMNFEIMKNENKKILLQFYITFCNLKKEKICIELNKIKSYNNQIGNMPKIINELLEQNFTLIEDINNLETDLKILRESKNEFLTTLKKCDSYYGQSIKMKMDFMDMGIDSDIFKSKEDYDFIAENISKRVNKKIRGINQIFKASSNGDNINAFQESCMEHHNIMVLILTDEKKCFGGFTQADFDNYNRYKFDENAFLFSINNREIYPIKPRYKKMAINCYDDWYISVFGNDIYICDCFFSNNGNITQEGFYDYSNSKVKGDYKLTGKKYFSVSELEVYEIIFLDN